MFEILTKQLTLAEELYTPFKFHVHLIFCIAATIVYILQYKLKGNKNCLLYMIGIDLTFITQLNTEPVTITTVAVCEVFILAVAFIRWIISKTKKTVPDGNNIENTENIRQTAAENNETKDGKEL